MNQNLKLIYMLSKVLGALEVVVIVGSHEDHKMKKIIEEIKQTLDEATKGESND